MNNASTNIRKFVSHQLLVFSSALVSILATWIRLCNVFTALNWLRLQNGKNTANIFCSRVTLAERCAPARIWHFGPARTAMLLNVSLSAVLTLSTVTNLCVHAIAYMCDRYLETCNKQNVHVLLLAVKMDHFYAHSGTKCTIARCAKQYGAIT